LGLAFFVLVFFSLGVVSDAFSVLVFSRDFSVVSPSLVVSFYFPRGIFEDD